MFKDISVEELFLQRIKEQASKELAEEAFKIAVAQHKEKLRNKKSWINKLFPFKLVIIRR